MPTTPAPPARTECGLCGVKIAYGQRENHAKAHGVHAWRIVWSPRGDFPCTAHEACVATGFAYGNSGKLAAHIARMAMEPPADDPEEPTLRPERLCTLDCDQPEKARGLCSGHLSRRDRGLPDWDAPLRKRPASRDAVAEANAVLERHGVIITVELPLVVLQQLAAVLVEHEQA